MQDRQLYEQILGIASPWFVERVELKLEQGEVRVYLKHSEQAVWHCAECGRECPLQREASGERGEIPPAYHSSTLTEQGEHQTGLVQNVRTDVVRRGQRRLSSVAAGTHPSTSVGPTSMTRRLACATRVKIASRSSPSLP